MLGTRTQSVSQSDKVCLWLYVTPQSVKDFQKQALDVAAATGQLLPHHGVLFKMGAHNLPEYDAAPEENEMPAAEQEGSDSGSENEE